MPVPCMAQKAKLKCVRLISSKANKNKNKDPRLDALVDSEEVSSFLELTGNSVPDKTDGLLSPAFVWAAALP